MTGLGRFLVTEIGVLLGGFLSVIAYKILTGGVATKGLLDDKETGELSVARVQTLAVTLGVSFYVLAHLSGPEARLPPIPEEVLLLLFGSNLGYLGVKSKILSFGR